jgi:hypothetical protein
MTTELDLERAISSWLQDVPPHSDRARRTVLGQIGAVHQRSRGGGPVWSIRSRHLSPGPRPSASTVAQRPLLLAAALGGLVLVAFLGAGSLLLSAGRSPSLGGVGGQPGTTAAPSTATAQPTAPMPSAGDPDLAALGHAVTVDGFSFSFRVPPSRLTIGWDAFGSSLVSKSIAGPQGAEAIVFWAGFPDGEDADPCINAPIEQWTAADVAAGVATAHGTEVVSGPTDVTVGGYPAKQVVVVVRADEGCDPGFFYNWKAQTGGTLWVRTELGDTIRVWIVNVDGRLLFIAGETHQDLGPGVAISEEAKATLDAEIQQIVDSIRFD